MQKETAQTQSRVSLKQMKAMMLANTSAGSFKQNKEQIDAAIDYLQEHGWDIEFCSTEKAGDGTQLAREAAEQKKDVVIAVGGDGTINEVIQGLANTDTALAVIPSGTMNVWAREVGIPLETERAREILTTGQIKQIDLGQTNDRYFLLMSTIGFDAEVTRTVETRPSKWGVFTYVVLGTWLGLSYPNFTVFMQIGKKTIRARALQVVFGNTQLYAGAIKFTWKARCDDGKIDITEVHSLNIWGRIRMLWDFLLRHPRRQRWVRYDTAEEVRLHTNIPVALQVDGDPIGYTSQRGYPPTIIRVVPGALKVLVPAELPEGLFSNTHSEQV